MIRTRYGWPQGTVPFSKTAFHEGDGYRTDAAGYISMCWDIPLHAPHSWGGLSTLSLESDGWAYEIDPREMQPGDALGLLGQGSVGPDGGTIIMFESWLNNDPDLGYVVAWEMLPGGPLGPVRRARPYNKNTWHSYRFRDITDSE
jgi:hypothetical protein